MSNSLSDYQTTDTKPLHITLVVPRDVEAPMFGGCIFTYYQSVCSCGWSGDYRASKLTAQEDKCPGHNIEKSQGHICFKNNREYWSSPDGLWVWSAPIENKISVRHRIGARKETGTREDYL